MAPGENEFDTPVLDVLNGRYVCSSSLVMLHPFPRKKCTYRLAGVAQWTEHGPANQRVASSILSQGTCLGCGPGPR